MPLIKPQPASKLRYRWFLEPKTAHTNEVISRHVGAEHFQDEMLTADSKRHPLWDVPYKLYAQLRTERKNGDRSLRFYVWRQELPNGKIILWPPAAAHTGA